MEKLITELNKEITLLESWIRTTEYGGWSTHLVEPMRKRVAELKSIVYDYQNKPTVWTKS